MADTTEDKQDLKGEEVVEETSVEKSTDNTEKVEDKGEDIKPKDDKPKVEDNKENNDGKGDKKEEKEDEEEESDEEEQPKMGLLEQPIVLEEGRKRERKKVERMTFQTPDVEKEKVEIKPGKGKTLGDIPIIEHRLNRVKVEDAKPLHRILFRRVGTAHEVKKNIRKFSGFPFAKGDPEYEKRMQILKSKSFTKSMLSQICDTLDVPRSGNKEEVTERLMEWLLKPEDSGRKVPKKRKATPKGKKKVAIKIKGKPKKTKAKSSDEDDDNDDSDKDDDSDDDSDSSDSDSSSDSEPEEPPKKKKKTEKPEKKEKKPKEKKEPVKKAEPKKKTPAKKKAVEEVSDISSDSDDDKPIVKPKAKGPPTNDELKEVIKKMLDSANLEEVTMKSVLKEIYAKYPDHDLADRKEFVKNTVKQIIS